MKIRVMVLGVFTFFYMTVQAVAGSVCSHVDLAWISEQVTLSPGTKIVFKQAQGDLCEVVLAIEGSLAPIYAGPDFLVAGRMFKQKRAITQATMDSLGDVAERERAEAKEKEALAVERRKVFFKTQVAALEPLVSMTFGPGNSTGAVYLITDPNCPHCKKILPQMEELAFEAKLTLKVIVYPVLGDKSRDMAAHALCNNFTYDQYARMTGGEALLVCERADTLLEKTKTLLASADILFVPVVVAEDGSWVVEGSDIGKVRAHLGLDCQEGEQGRGEGCGAEEK